MTNERGCTQVQPFFISAMPDFRLKFKRQSK